MVTLKVTITVCCWTQRWLVQKVWPSSAVSFPEMHYLSILLFCPYKLRHQSSIMLYFKIYPTSGLLAARQKSFRNFVSYCTLYSGSGVPFSVTPSGRNGFTGGNCTIPWYCWQSEGIPKDPFLPCLPKITQRKRNPPNAEADRERWQWKCWETYKEMHATVPHWSWPN